MKRFLLLCMLLVLLPQPSAHALDDANPVEQALGLIRDGKVEMGVEALQTLAEGGNAEAMFHVGEIHRLGIGREVSVPIATMYYRFASQLNHERAALSLANILFFEGNGTEKENSEALDIWQTLTLKGNLEAAYMLGMLYWNGEAGVARDPIRGYALVWLAFEGGYADAEQNELSMKALLSSDAKEVAYDYAKNLADRGFTSKPLAIHLLAHDEAERKAAIAQEKSAEEDVPLEKPDDWTTVWRLEVGFAMSEMEVERLQRVISSTQAEAVGDLYSEVLPSANRPGLFRLIFGPAKSVNDAVSRCVALKRAGHDCFARPPEEDDADSPY
ncbi:tetratricopeptide repeat protein [Kordiimonas pumila]|uniref:Tetratricopeptide repeat protein n=1 Tax=Kordiimonas pumila TaxID=2161677 RepID=A0ABV7D4D7_9PROT|nr:sel1 repeat family protein [Kordiimonas pumila]